MTRRRPPDTDPPASPNRARAAKARDALDVLEEALRAVGRQADLVLAAPHHRTTDREDQP